MNESGDSRATATRRRFLDGFLFSTVAALCGVIAYPVLRYLSPPKVPEAAGSRVLAGTVSELAKDGWKIFPFGSEPGILIEPEPGQFRAFAGTCTHLECTVQFEKESKRIWCACHNGWYDVDGRNVEGPPPRPLEAYDVQVVGEEIFVNKS